MSRFVPVETRERMIRETEKELNQALKQPTSDCWRARLRADCRAARRHRQPVAPWATNTNPLQVLSPNDREPKHLDLARWFRQIVRWFVRPRQPSFQRTGT